MLKPSRREASRCEPEAERSLPVPAPGLSAEGFAELWGQHAGRLWALALGLMRHRHDAEDVLQAAAVTGLAKRDGFQPGTSFYAWMGQVVRYVAANEQRRRSKVRRHHAQPRAGAHAQGLTDAADPMDRLPAPPHTPAPRLPHAPERLVREPLDPDAADLDDRLRRALAELTPQARACLLLRTLEGAEYAEIAELVGVPPGTAMSHVHRSRRKLRQSLGDGHA